MQIYPELRRKRRRINGAVTPYKIDGREVFLATFRDVKRRRQTKSLRTRDDGEARAICGCLQVYARNDFQTPADVSPLYAHPTALTLYFGALDTPSIEVSDDGSIEVKIGSLAGELPKYASDNLDEKRDQAFGLIREHIQNPEIATSVLEIVCALDAQRRQAGGYALAYAAKASDLTVRDQLVAKLREQVTDLQRLCAEKDRLLNRHVSVTLEKAFEDFCEDYRPGGEATKKQVQSRLRAFIWGDHKIKSKIIDGLGPDRQLTSITPAEIDRWLDNYPATTTTVLHARAYLSVFWTTCKRLYQLTHIPFDLDRMKKRGSMLSIAKKKAPEAIKTVDELKTLLKSLDTELYWKSWIAFACLAGPRWSEQKALRVSDLHLDADPPRVVIQATEKHDVKTRGNTVPIERQILLSIIREYVATLPKDQHLVWPSLSRRDALAKDSNGYWRHHSFYRELAEKLSAAQIRSGNDEQPYWKYGPSEWRHTFGTLLALSGRNTTEIARMMRNSSEIASAHYVNFFPMDERIGAELAW